MSENRCLDCSLFLRPNESHRAWQLGLHAHAAPHRSLCLRRKSVADSNHRIAVLRMRKLAVLPWWRNCEGAQAPGPSSAPFPSILAVLALHSLHTTQVKQQLEHLVRTISSLSTARASMPRSGGPKAGAQSGSAGLDLEDIAAAATRVFGAFTRSSFPDGVKCEVGTMSSKAGVRLCSRTGLYQEVSPCPSHLPRPDVAGRDRHLYLRVSKNGPSIAL